MKAFLNLLALACLALAVIGSIVSGHPTKDESEDIVKELSETEMTPIEIYNLLLSQESSHKVFKNFAVRDFDLFSNFDADDCTRGHMPKRENFIEEFKKMADGSLIHKNLLGFCESLYGEMVRFCEIMESASAH